MWSSFVKSNHEETDSIRSTPILLGIDLCLLINASERCAIVKYVGLVLSAIEETRRLAGIGRL